MFSSPLYTGHKSVSRRHLPGTLITRDGRYWVPLIALFSGMRAGEIVQLQLKDVRLNDQWWVFDINKGDDGSKAVKTASSLRQVPIHPSLMELGFMEWVEGEKNVRPVFDPTSVDAAIDPTIWQLFIDSCVLRGPAGALKLLPDGLRQTCEAALKKAEAIWNPKKLWSHWQMELDESGLLDTDITPKPKKTKQFGADIS